MDQNFVPSYTTGISMCGRAKLWQEALTLFEAMPKTKNCPSVISYSAAISACEKGGQWQKALILFEAMPKARISPNVISYSAGISACEKGGQWQKALILFEAIPRARISPNVISYSAAISACEKGGQWQEALMLFASMPRTKIAPSVISYNAAISACEKGGQWQEALMLFASMPRTRIAPSVISYSAAISACEKGGQWQEALFLFEAMPTAKISPDVISCSAAISACEKGGQWQEALFLFEAMPTAKISPDVISYNAAISACEKGGQWQKALILFEAMPRTKIAPSVISYNAAISACEKGGQWQEALMLFASMPRTRIAPSVISYNAAISACEKGGQWQEALMLFASMPRTKIAPSVISYNAAISACKKGGQWQEALMLIESMDASRVECSIVTYNAMLDCKDVYSRQGLGGSIFKQGLLRILSQPLVFQDRSVDLHDLSEGAARLTLQWWLSNYVRRCLEINDRLRCIVVTGYGKSRKSWQTSDIRAAALELLKTSKFEAHIDPKCLASHRVIAHICYIFGTFDHWKRIRRYTGLCMRECINCRFAWINYHRLMFEIVPQSNLLPWFLIAMPPGTRERSNWLWPSETCPSCKALARSSKKNDSWVLPQLCLGSWYWGSALVLSTWHTGVFFDHFGNFDSEWAMGTRGQGRHTHHDSYAAYQFRKHSQGRLMEIFTGNPWLSLGLILMLPLFSRLRQHEPPSSCWNMCQFWCFFSGDEGSFLFEPLKVYLKIEQNIGQKWARNAQELLSNGLCRCASLQEVCFVTVVWFPVLHRFFDIISSSTNLKPIFINMLQSSSCLFRQIPNYTCGLRSDLANHVPLRAHVVGGCAQIQVLEGVWACKRSIRFNQSPTSQVPFDNLTRPWQNRFCFSLVLQVILKNNAPWAKGNLGNFSKLLQQLR